MRITDQKGVAIVEFALVLPVLVILVFGMIEFGLLLYNQQVITNASREGARAGIVAPDASGQRRSLADITSVVESYCNSRLINLGDGGTSPNTTTVPASPTTATFGTDLIVTVTYDWDFLVLQNLGFSPFTMTSRTVMKYE